MDKIKLRITVVTALAVFLLKGTDTCTTDRPDSDGCCLCTDIHTEEYLQQTSEGTRENHCCRDCRNCCSRQGSQCGGQDARVSFQCTGCHAESLSD